MNFGIFSKNKKTKKQTTNKKTKRELLEISKTCELET